MSRPVFVVDGCRTPFLRSGTAFRDQSAYDLGRAAIAGLLHRSGADPGEIELVVMGTVVADPDTSNVAREAALGAGVPDTCPAFTVTAACISANIAFREVAAAISDGSVEVGIAGGTETLSDVPIRFSRPIRKRLIAGRRARGPLDWLRLARGLRLRDLAPAVPEIADFSTGLTMGQNAERLAKRLGIEREAQDGYAFESHRRAARASAEGWLGRQIVPLRLPPDHGAIEADNGIRADSSLEKLGSLPPAFDRDLGTITAGNSSFLTDGASAVLLASEEGAMALGRSPRARLVAEALVAMDPLEELLTGPAVAVPLALERAGLELAAIDVFEFHEAFAAQLLAVLRLLGEDRIDPGRLNAWGGSLSIGHPFGATGGRLVTTCVHRLAAERGRYGLVAACASGALGYAAVLERVES